MASGYVRYGWQLKGSLAIEAAFAEAGIDMRAQWMAQEWLPAHCPKVQRLSDTVAARPDVAPVPACHFGA